MRAIAYRRCSTEGQVTEGVSLANQAEKIRSYAQYRGMEITAEIEDAGVSGGLNRARAGFVELLDRVQAGGIDAVVVYSLDRLSRDMLTALALERFLHEHGVELHTVDGMLDTSSPDGFVNFAMQSLLSEVERRRVKFRTKAAMAHKKANGKVFNHTPYGYDRDGGELVLNSSEQSIIETINRMYDGGEKLHSIVEYLNTSATPTKRGGAWSPQQVKNLIASYRGKFKKSRNRVSDATRAFIEAIA